MRRSNNKHFNVDLRDTIALKREGQTIAFKWGENFRIWNEWQRNI